MFQGMSSISGNVAGEYISLICYEEGGIKDNRCLKCNPPWREGDGLEIIKEFP